MAGRWQLQRKHREQPDPDIPLWRDIVTSASGNKADTTTKAEAIASLRDIRARFPREEYRIVKIGKA